MKTNRIVALLVVLLCVAAVGLSVRVVQLRRQLTHAQAYVQSGLENWRFACGRVSSMLKKHANDPDALSALKDVANACIPHSDYLTVEEADAVGKDSRNPDPRGLIMRIDRAVETGDYLIVKDRPNGDYPKGYRP